MLNSRIVLIGWLMALSASACGGSAALESPGGAGVPAVGSAGALGVAGSGGAGAGAGGLSSAGRAGMSGEAGAGEPCFYKDVPRAVGVPFLCECNTCWCDADGSISGTQVECQACRFLGVGYDVGDSFTAEDGCNRCGCSEGGGVGCTQIGCNGVPVPHYWRHYVSRDPRACMLLDYACPPNTKPFSDEEGCGCEQDQDCPQPIACGGGIPDCEDGPIQCPYSKLD